MTGLEKAAVLLLSLGETTAAQVMQHMDEATLNGISSTMTRMRRLDTKQSQQVLREFTRGMQDSTGRNVDSFHYVRDVLDSALGEREAARVMEYIMRGDSMAMTMDIMKETTPAMLAEQLRNERPQAIALVLAHLDPAAGADLLSHLAPDVAQNVLYRYAKLDTIQPHILRDLATMLGEQLSGELGVRELSDIGGPRKAADLLNNVEGTTSERMLSEFADSELADSIRENMFTFSDLVTLDSRSLQALIREIPHEDLVPALKGAAPEVVDKLLENVSTRAAEALREDLDSGPPVRRATAEEAKKSILRVARRLDAEGTITISSDEDLL
ncbi:flagellar motor switch protein FliG [Salinisphaera sp. RV14]|uniref:flagellar motor switch protein FliG n=1 Tax=unclassified Salinisphaera TaxID=2649847 RepID=UPI003F863BDE